MVKCFDCGYLAIRKRQTNEPAEATERTRTKGMDCTPGESGPANVFCYANKRTFSFESPVSGANVLTAISEEISCDGFRCYHPGKTPKEHEDMSIVEQVRAETRLATERAERIADRRHRSTLLVAIFAAIIACAGTIISNWNFIAKHAAAWFER